MSALSMRTRNTTMAEISEPDGAAQRARTHALIVPREHGAWGLLLVPLFTGLAAGFSATHRVWLLLVFTIVALSLFWLRTPVESLVGTGFMAAHIWRERRIAIVATVFLVLVLAVCLTNLMWKGRDLELLLLGAAAAFAFVIRFVGGELDFCRQPNSFRPTAHPLLHALLRFARNLLGGAFCSWLSRYCWRR